MSRMKDLLGDRYALPIYPDVPGFKAPGTSQDAANVAQRTAGNLRELAYAAIVGSNTRGLTADDVAAKLNKSVLSIRPRISELLAQHRIRANGERRTNVSGLKADVYVIQTRKPA